MYVCQWYAVLEKCNCCNSVTYVPVCNNDSDSDNGNKMMIAMIM